MHVAGMHLPGQAEASQQQEIKKHCSHTRGLAAVAPAAFVQRRMAAALESREAHYVVIGLVLLDLAIVLTELVLSSFYPDHSLAPHIGERQQGAPKNGVHTLAHQGGMLDEITLNRSPLPMSQCQSSRLPTPDFAPPPPRMPCPSGT